MTTQEPAQQPEASDEPLTLAALHARLRESRARADLLNDQLASTQDWLAATRAELQETQAGLRESQARADLLNEQLTSTQEWLAATYSRIAEMKEILARTEADSQERLAAFHDARAQVETLTEALARTEADSQKRRAAIESQRARTDALAEALIRTEADSQQRLTLLRAERARTEILRRRLAEEGIVIPAAELALPAIPEGRDGRLDVSAAGADKGSSEADQWRPVRIARTNDIVTVIRPAEPGLGVNLHELWQYRHLFIALVRRNIRVEFDATRLGSIWGIMRPLLLALVFVTFRNFSNAETREGLPYLVWVYTGLLFWTYFTDAATNAAVAVRNDAPLLTKVYYPRLLTPVVPIIAGLVTLGIGLVPIVGMMLWYGIGPGWSIVLLPLVVVQCVALALGLGTIISSISIENRDWERLFIFGLTVGLWLSPVIYAPEMIPTELRGIYMLNPMVGLMLGFRAALFDGFQLPLWEWAYSLAASLLLLMIGIWAFRRTEIRLMDRL